MKKSNICPLPTETIHIGTITIDDLRKDIPYPVIRDFLQDKAKRDMEITEPISCAIRGRSNGEWHDSNHEQRLEIGGGGISNSITSVAKDAYVLRAVRTNEERLRWHRQGDIGARFSAKEFTPRTDGITNTIDTVQKDNLLMEKVKKNVRYRIRKLTPRECFRLMGVRDSDIDIIQSAGISESRQYALAGNSIVVDCMVNGIFKNLFIKNESTELTLF